MYRKLLLGTFFAFVIVGSLLSSFGIDPVAAADEPIYINPDGSISKHANIVTYDNVTYTFTDNIDDAIVVYRGNIVIDGAGCTLQNPGGHDNGIEVSEDNVTIENVKIRGFPGAGVYLILVTQCKILHSTLMENGGGISTQLYGSTGIIISGNKITNNGRGIYLQGGSLNSIYGNDIIGHPKYALRFHFGANNNSIYDNNIVDNNQGGLHASIDFSGGSQYNMFYHNNIIGNSPLVNFENDWRPNYWNNGSVGNYWSTYTGQDSNGDGIGDTPYNMSSANVDYYPFMSQIGTVVRDFAPYSQEVTLASNSTVQNFQFSDTLKQISFNVTGVTGTSGYCDIAFPKALLSGTITVTKNDAPLIQGVDYTQTDNSTHHVFHITYTHSTHTIKIVGTEAIPEFTSAMILPLFMTLSILVVMSTKKKLHKKTQA